MKTIAYHPNGLCYADADCEQSARKFLTGTWEYIAVANELFITAARALIAEKVIPHTEVQFVFRGKTLAVNSGGRLQEWPMGFCDTNELLLSRILSAR